MSEQQELDLSYVTNQRWAMKVAVIWTLLMIPSDIASIREAVSLYVPLVVLGLAGFWIVYLKSFRTLAGGLSLGELRKRGMKAPWTLLLGMCFWHLFTSMTIFPILVAVFTPVVPV